MVLFGLINGRNTGTRLVAVSWLSRNICVWICPLATGAELADTAPLCNLASASGTTKNRPEDSTNAKPCVRNCAENRRKACAGVAGTAVTSVMVPFTRGSTTTLRPLITAMVRETASMSALMKLSVTGALERDATLGGLGTVCAVCACDDAGVPITRKKTARKLTPACGPGRMPNAKSRPTDL